MAKPYAVVTVIFDTDPDVCNVKSLWYKMKDGLTSMTTSLLPLWDGCSSFRAVCNTRELREAKKARSSQKSRCRRCVPVHPLLERTIPPILATYTTLGSASATVSVAIAGLIMEHLARHESYFGSSDFLQYMWRFTGLSR